MKNDKPKCHCGIFGIFGSETSASTTYYGLHALQHRGQEAAGIVTLQKTINGKRVFNKYKGSGLVSEVFRDPTILTDKLKGYAAIGHNRYSTTGGSDSFKNIQPFDVHYRFGNLAIAHNGNLTNTGFLRDKLEKDGAVFQSTTDSEVILHLIARSKLDNQINQVKDAISQIEGAYCLVILSDNQLIGVRDPLGIRPMCLGKKDGAFVISSETCALDINKIEYIRDVLPGEMIIIDDEVLSTGNVKSEMIFSEKKNPKHCVFEYIYFSRPDSMIFGHNVDKMRRKLGKILALNHPVVDKLGEKIVVMAVPDSSNTAALGYQNQLEKMGIKSKFELGLIRNHYVGRTFIQPGQTNREMSVRVKFNTVKGVLKDKTIVVIDDSIVRGTTSKLLVNLLREAGPKEIHMRISSPPILFPCFYGMDFPSKEELIANKFNQNIDKIRDELGVDSLEYLEIDEMLSAMIDFKPEDFCAACFSGKYPIQVNKTSTKEQFD